MVKKKLKPTYSYCKSCNEKLDIPRITGLCNGCVLKLKKEKNIRSKNLNEY